jgi:hypothetical protein
VNNKKDTIRFKRAINRKINSHNERVKVCFITSNQWFWKFPTECITFQLRFNSLYSSFFSEPYLLSNYMALLPKRPSCSVINQFHYHLGHVYHCAMNQFHITRRFVGYCVKPQWNVALIFLPFKKTAFFSDKNLTQFYKNAVFKTRKFSSSVNCVTIQAQFENRPKGWLYWERCFMNILSSVRGLRSHDAEFEDCCFGYVTPYDLNGSYRYIGIFCCLYI